MEATTALQYRVFFQQNKKIYYRDIARKTKYFNIENIKIPFSERLELKEYSRCIGILADCKNKIKTGHIKIEDYFSTINALLKQIEGHLIKNEIKIEKLFGDNEMPYHYIKQSTSAYDLIDWLIKIINNLKEIYVFSSNVYNKEVKKAIEFIDQNYTDHIKLSILSDNLQVSYPYLSKLFKTQTGKSFSQYLNEVRINKAKLYLKQSTFKTY